MTFESYASLTMITMIFVIREQLRIDRKKRNERLNRDREREILREEESE